MKPNRPRAGLSPSGQTNKLLRAVEENDSLFDHKILKGEKALRQHPAIIFLKKRSEANQPFYLGHPAFLFKGKHNHQGRTITDISDLTNASSKRTEYPLIAGVKQSACLRHNGMYSAGMPAVSPQRGTHASTPPRSGRWSASAYRTPSLPPKAVPPPHPSGVSSISLSPQALTDRPRVLYPTPTPCSAPRFTIISPCLDIGVPHCVRWPPACGTGLPPFPPPPQPMHPP